VEVTKLTQGKSEVIEKGINTWKTDNTRCKIDL